jgi:threonine/homoserine/homoserine lactone efflux protein
LDGGKRNGDPKGLIVIAAVAPALTALGLGLALAGAPGPVQAVLLAESTRGGVPRGLRALVGVHGTFGLLMVSLALGLSVATPAGLVVRGLRVAGGALLLLLAIDGARSPGQPGAAPKGRRTLPPAVRGSLSIVLNPGAWLFLGAVASPLLVGATRRGGTAGALLAAVALVAGAAAGDVGVVLLGGLGLRRLGIRAAGIVRLALAVALAALGVWLMISGIFVHGAGAPKEA